MLLRRIGFRGLRLETEIWRLYQNKGRADGVTKQSCKGFSDAVAINDPENKQVESSSLFKRYVDEKEEIIRLTRRASNEID